MKNRNLVEVKRLDSGLSLTWSDGTQDAISSEKLRRSCPCASCMEARGDTSHSEPLTPKKRSLMIVEHSKDEQLKLDAVWAVGNYALGLKWADGHSTGIYSFSLLEELAKT